MTTPFQDPESAKSSLPAPQTPHLIPSRTPNPPTFPFQDPLRHFPPAQSHHGPLDFVVDGGDAAASAGDEARIRWTDRQMDTVGGGREQLPPFPPTFFSFPFFWGMGEGNSRPSLAPAKPRPLSPRLHRKLRRRKCRPYPSSSLSSPANPRRALSSAPPPGRGEGGLGGSACCTSCAKAPRDRGWWGAGTARGASSDTGTLPPPIPPPRGDTSRS